MLRKNCVALKQSSEDGLSSCLSVSRVYNLSDKIWADHAHTHS